MDYCWITVLLFVLGYMLFDALGLLVWALNRWVMAAVAAITHLFTITIASSQGIPAAVLTMFTLGFAQAYWIVSGWAEKGAFWHPLTCMCAVLLASIFIEFTGRFIYRNEIAGIHARRAR